MNNEAELRHPREKVIIRTSIIGILANLLLAGFKAAVGIIANSIAVTLDAVNNLSDALSSVITIIGTKLAGKKPDKKHPLGHGRIEYLSAMIIAAIVLYAGITSFVESVKKIIHPVQADYAPVSLVIIASAVVVKLILGRYVKKKGAEVESASLVASGSDALFDAILSASVLASAVIFLLTGLSLEAYVGALISIFIVKSGIEMLRETLSEILGKRADRETVEAIRRTIIAHEGVMGVYDLILHNYGPSYTIGSVHVEVPDTMNAVEIDRLERHLAGEVFQKHGVLLSGIGIYAANTKDDEAARIRTDILRMVNTHEGVLQTHGFYADLEKKTIAFDVILDFAMENREEVFRKIVEEVSAAYPDYKCQIILDIDA